MLHYRRYLTYTILAGLACTSPPQQPPRIVIDGELDDWSAVPLLASGGGVSDEGWARMWASNDEFALLVRFEVPEEISLQNGNTLELCLDTDDDSLTGQSLEGFGAELCWSFGERTGQFVSGTGTAPVEHQHIGLISAPTVTGRSFEVALARDAEPVDGQLLFTGRTVGLLLRDTDSGRRLPVTGGYHYRFQSQAPAPLHTFPLAKRSSEHVRFLSYNLNNHLTEPERRDALARVLNAVDADVILLQEIRDTPTAEAVAYVRSLLDRGGAPWHTLKIGGESTVVFSTFPIMRADSLGDSGGLLLQLGSEAQMLLLVALSMPCCDEQERRTQEADLIAAYVRDAKSGAGDFRISDGTPILLMGDANLVGLHQDRLTLLNGDIVDRETFGEPFAPDWDDTPLTDLVPRHTHRPYTFTWHGEDFPPGRLDYVIYSDSRLQIGNRYVLYTPELPVEVLRRNGLDAGDTDVVTDHLPLVADLILHE